MSIYFDFAVWLVGGKNVIKIENVSFTYDKAVSESAVCEINIQIPKGQTILLFGESGSGKTTFGRLINGLIPAYYEGELNGHVTVAGKDIEKLELHELTPYVGSVFQNPKSQFYTLLTDTEIVFACENIGMERNNIAENFEKTVESLHIDKLLGKNLFAISGGEKQKIACASVHALMPEVFVLDEPTSNLDIGTIQDLQKILKEWKAQGKTVVIAEHRIAWLHDIVDRILFFQDGRIKGDFNAKDFWAISPDEFHSMGLRAASNFLPNIKEIEITSENVALCGFHLSVGSTELLSIEHLEIPKGAVVAVLGDKGA